MCLEQDEIEALRAGRELYRYPAVALEGELEDLRHVEFRDVFGLEIYLQKLLRAPSADDVVLGYLSVIYWGHYSGQRNRPTAARALGRARMAYGGPRQHVTTPADRRYRTVRDVGEECIAEEIRRAVEMIGNGSYGEAVGLMAKELPGVGFSFASKIASFIEPQRCGVIDSVLAEKCPCFGFETREGYVANRVINRSLYTDYCKWLQRVALWLNQTGDESKWRLNGSLHGWRAVDVERALFAGQPLRNLCTGSCVEVGIDEFGSEHQKFERKTSG